MTQKTRKSRPARRRPAEPPPEEEYRVEDRRHWAVDDDDEAGDGTTAPAVPAVVDEYRQRAEQAEAKLQEYIEAFKGFREEQEQFRRRLQADVDRRVALQFGELVRDLLESVDNLDLAFEHAGRIPEAQPLLEGLELVRGRFVAALEKHGVQRICPEGTTFDPNESEAVRMDGVDRQELDGQVTETLRPGYRLGDLVLRPARVAVGRHAPSA